MNIIRYKEIYFFFEDNAEYLCENCLLKYHYPSRFPITIDNSLHEFVENYYYYLCDLPTNYDRLFTEGALCKELTGLKYIIWVDNFGKDRNVGHNKPRLKVEYKGKHYPLYFKDEVEFANPGTPKELLKELPNIQKFVYDNRNILLAQWYRKFKTFEGFKNKIAQNQYQAEIIDRKTLDKLLSD